VVIDALKQAEDGQGLIMRLHEYQGGNSTIALQAEDSDFYNLTNLMEINEAERCLLQNKTIKLSFGPYEVKTVRIS
jgi:alpha-mannosidase